MISIFGLWRSTRVIISKRFSLKIKKNLEKKCFVLLPDVLILSVILIVLFTRPNCALWEM